MSRFFDTSTRNIIADVQTPQFASAGRRVARLGSRRVRLREVVARVPCIFSASACLSYSVPSRHGSGWDSRCGCGGPPGSTRLARVARLTGTGKRSPPDQCGAAHAALQAVRRKRVGGTSHADMWDKLTRRTRRDTSQRRISGSTVTPVVE